jgi:hypothetical protein
VIMPVIILRYYLDFTDVRYEKESGHAAKSRGNHTLSFEHMLLQFAACSVLYTTVHFLDV